MHELTNLELRLVIGELQPLIGARLDNLYGPGDGRFRIRFRTPSSTADLMLDLQGKLLYLTRRIEKSPPQPDNFVMGLRKRLKNSKLTALSQHGFDRVAVFELGAKEGKFLLIAELFSSGNLVLCDSDYKILQCARREEWRDRAVRLGGIYSFPRSKTIEPHELDAGRLKALMTDRHVISTLARAVPIGTLYLEEALARADIDAEAEGKTIDGKRLGRLAEIIGAISSSPAPRLYEPAGGKPEFSFCELSDHSLSKETKLPTLSEAIDEALARQPSEALPDEGLLKKREKLERALREQTETLAKYEKEEREAKAKGDAIYTNYEAASRALEEGKKARKQNVEAELSD